MKIFEISAVSASFGALLAALLAGNALALETSPASPENKLHRMSVDEIARKIDRRPKWRVLAAEPTVIEQKTQYRFKLLEKEEGRVKIIIIDPDKPQLNQFD